jgi:histidinol-phosphate phosphatase family protein
MKAVFLDRDETLISNTGDLGDPDLVRLLPGVADGIQALHKAGWTLFVVTNQGGVARGVFTMDDVHATHDRVQHLLTEATGLAQPIHTFYACPWHPNGTVEPYVCEHSWRKPSPGMLLAAAEQFDVKLIDSWLVGDAPRDIAAGQATGCDTILLGNAPCTPPPTHRCETLPQAAALIGEAYP